MRRTIRSAHCLIAFALLVHFFPPAASAADVREQMIARAKEEGTVVIAGSRAGDLRDRLKGFHETYPFISIKAITSNSADTVNRIVTEAQAGKSSIDLVTIGIPGTELLAQRGLFRAYEFPHLVDFPKGSQPPHGLYVDVVGNPTVQGVYNTEMIPPDQAPNSWEEMLNPKWRGMSLISRSSEEFPVKLAWLWRTDGDLNWERSFDYFEKLITTQKPMIARGYSGGTQRVAAGEVGIFWFASITTAVHLALRGAPIDLIAFPKFPISYSAFGILKEASHPAAAWLLIDYVTSPEGQFEYTDRISPKITLNKKAKPGKLAQWMVKHGAGLENGDPTDPSMAPKLYNETALKKSEDFFFKLLGIK